MNFVRGTMSVTQFQVAGCLPCPVIKEQIRVLAEHSLSNIRSQTSLMLSFAVMILESLSTFERLN